MKIFNGRKTKTQYVTIIHIMVMMTAISLAASVGIKGVEGKAGHDIADLIKQLNTRHRAKASSLLAKVGKSAVGPLEKALRNTACYSYANNAAALTLAAINTPNAVKALTKALLDKELANHIRRSAARGLGVIKGNRPPTDRRIGAVLSWVLQDRGLNEGIRGMAAWALGNYGSKSTAVLLEETLKEKALRYRAAQGLARITLPAQGTYKGRALAALLTVLKDRKNMRFILSGEIRAALVRSACRESVARLIGCLEYKNYYARRRITEALLEIGEPAENQLIAALRHKNATIRRISARVLGIQKTERAALPLVECLKSTDWMLRDESAVALVRINSKRSAKHLRELLKDSGNSFRESAAWVLSRLK